jgi:hypothetical protein
MPDDIRGWLTEAVARRARHPELEKTLFHQLKELERGPLEQLGELVRAVVEELRIAQQRLAEQAVDVRTLQQTVAVLTERLDDLATRVPAPPVEAGYVLLLPAPDGYRLAQREGLPPAPGELVDGFRVLNRGRSPLPGDRRPCLLALPDGAGPA